MRFFKWILFLRVRFVSGRFTRVTDASYSMMLVGRVLIGTEVSDRSVR